jgi:hypothetical protein
MDILINEAIPGYKNREQLILLGKLIQTLKPRSVIAEIGSCAGMGTWTISQNAPSESQIFAIDWWQNKTVFGGYGFNLDPEARDSQAYFEQHVQDCHNITPIRGDACEVPFHLKVDCLIIDCDWGLNKNNHFPIWELWKKRLNKGALIIGANYFEHRPDEVAFADFVSTQTERFQTEHGLWWCYDNT